MKPAKYENGGSMEELLMYYLRIALQYHVTDIHFSLMDEDRLKVEMRVGGIIRELKDQKADIRFFRWLLYRSNMDVSRMMHPQTGHRTSFVNIKKNIRIS